METSCASSNIGREKSLRPQTQPSITERLRSGCINTALMTSTGEKKKNGNDGLGMAALLLKQILMDWSGLLMRLCKLLSCQIPSKDMNLNPIFLRF